MKIAEYFDSIYVLNLRKRKDRLFTIRERLESAGISDYIVFPGIEGAFLQKAWESFSRENRFFSNPNYFACALAHLCIYEDAVENAKERILILEDDVRVSKYANLWFSESIQKIPENWDLLYLGFIPLSDDLSHWDYNVLNSRFLTERSFLAKNLWGLYSYGISKSLMIEMIEIYKRDFPMEIDRFFVSNVQEEKKCYGLLPQIFAVEDGYSDNSLKVETGMLQRSIDTRFSKAEDYL